MARFAPVGLVLGVLALAHAAVPASDFGPGDPALQLRGWPAFARTVDGARQAAGAGWVGTLSYGVNAQLQAADPALPVLQIDERDRYAGLPPRMPDLAKPGLIVDLRRRLDLARLRACFATVGPPGELNRAVGRAADERYAVVAVAKPKIDLLGQGCEPGRPSAISR